MEEFVRTQALLGENSIETLKNKKVAIFGIGGVGGYVAETLARSGIGNFILVDNDVVSVSNINRQIIALHSTVGKFKTEVMSERIKDINGKANVTTYNLFVDKNTLPSLDLSGVDYMVDCIDTVTSKILLIETAKEKNIKIISCMGTGNKVDPLKFKIDDISKTSVCPLARVMRAELKKRNILNVKVLFSTELPKKVEYTKQIKEEMEKSGKRQIPSSSAFCPSVAGILLAREVILELLEYGG